MSTVEREYIKHVDEEILNASGESLKKLQELDMKTQLQENTFYDAYSSFKEEEPKKEKITSSTKSSRKKNPK